MAPVRNRISADDPPPPPNLASLNRNARSSPGLIQRTTTTENRQSLAVQLRRKGSTISQSLAVPIQKTSNKQRHSSAQNKNTRALSIASLGSRGSSGGSSGGSHEGSDSRLHRRHRHKKNKEDNLFTRVRDYLAESDVFTENQHRAPYIVCLYFPLVTIPLFFTILLWDTLSVACFEIPHLSTIDQPAVVVQFQFICVLLAMYGLCVQVLITAPNRTTSLSRISFVLHFFLFLWRIFLELKYDGYRSQEKHYVPRTDES